MKHRLHLQFPSRQRGAVLVVALLMLLVMTVLGVTAMQMSRMEERMAGNSRDINLAFQGAEAGLRDAEERLRVLIARPTTCAAAPCAIFRQAVLPTDMRSADTTWWTTNGREYGVPAPRKLPIPRAIRSKSSKTWMRGRQPDRGSRAAGRPQFLSRHRQFHRRERHGAGAAREYVLEAVLSQILF